MAAIHEIGPITAENIVGFFAQRETRKIIEKLKAAGVNMESSADVLQEAGPLQGKTIVVTGTLQNYSRSEIEEKIRSLGGRAASSVSKKTDYLVAGEVAGSKLAKAQKLDVTILSEDDFEELTKG